MRCLRCVTDMQAMHPKSPHVSGRTARCPRSVSRAPLAARSAEHASVPHSNASMKHARVEAEKPTLDTRPFMTEPALNAKPAKVLPSAVYLISYLNEARRQSRIAHLLRSPISSFTIFSTLPMASEEPFSGILPGWVARRALRIQARPLGASPISLGPTEPVAAPSRRVVQQLAAPVKLDEEWRVALRRHGGEHTGTGVVAAASYRATSV